jgi:hypothetical protein
MLESTLKKKNSPRVGLIKRTEATLMKLVAVTFNNIHDELNRAIQQRDFDLEAFKTTINEEFPSLDGSQESQS